MANKTKIRFGLGIPTGTEGLMYPIPYSSAREVVELSVFAEKMGFDSVWGNDHVQSQQYVMEEFGEYPRYYAPLLELAAIAERTTTLQVCTALLVAPFRHPVVMAKELATLDHLSGGRLLVGVGIGAYREEFEAEYGDKASEMVRGDMLDESLEVMCRIFKEETVDHQGRYYSVKNLKSFPKPVQSPFPFYIGGNSPKGYQRVAKFGTGWLPALLTTDEIKAGIKGIEACCAEVGRNMSDIDIAPQLGIAVAKTREEAEKMFQSSQLYKHGVSLSKSTMKGKDATQYAQRNLVGTPDEVGQRIEEYVAAGVTHFSALIFANNTMQETKDHMQYFSEEVLAKLNK